MALARPLYLTNSFGRKLEEFAPIDPPRVTMYSCGPTVYSYAHIGNLRAYLFADSLRRVLLYNGYEVTMVRNITDVGHLTNDTLDEGLDKIEEAAQRENMTPWDIAERVTRVFLRDCDRLNIQRPEEMPRATQFIGPMVKLVQCLIDRGYGYESGGNVYYDVSKFPRYGDLSGNSVSQLISGARVEVDEGKRSPADFALWRAAGPDKIMRWESPWGEGVPGWHLECSAMAIDFLGEQLDIHVGGIDHLFPHHEDEIAQSESATGKRFARYWLHNAFLQMTGDAKMSKSLGNIFLLQDVIERGIHPLALRYFSFQAHYRTSLNCSWKALEAAGVALERAWQQVAELVQEAGSAVDDRAGQAPEEAERYQAQFHEAINHDLELPRAVAVLHEVLGAKLPARHKLALVEDFDRVLGLDLLKTARRLLEVTPQQQQLLDERATARSEKRWARSDELRTQLQESGIDVKDSPGGQHWINRRALVFDEPAKL